MAAHVLKFRQPGGRVRCPHHQRRRDGQRRADRDFCGLASGSVLDGAGGNFGVVTFKDYDFGPMMRIGVSVYKLEQAGRPRYAAAVSTLPCTVCWRAALKHYMSALPFVLSDYVADLGSGAIGMATAGLRCCCDGSGISR